MQIKAFCGLTPRPDLAASVAAVPYDVVDTEEARALAADRPYDLLHVDRAEIDLPADTDPYSDIVYATAARNLQKLIADGILQRESAPVLYLYQQQMGEHVQTGIIAACHIDDYGNDIIKKAGELLRAADAAGELRFHGNVEGNDIFKGTVDIVVCDGFVGNVLLKTSEGLASMLTDFIKQEFTRNVFTKLAAVVAMPVLQHFKHRVDPRRYNGAALLGLRGLVFKSHGSADAFAFQTALNRAYDAARNRLLDRVHDRILETLATMPAAGAEPQTEPPALAASR